jgi:SAM-dependent methyltransferase
MQTIDVERCHVCGARGVRLYEGLRDRLFAASGSWNMLQCPNPACGLLWLNPMPAPQDVHRAYESYYTHHQDRPRTGVLDRLFLAAKRGYVANHYDYAAPVAYRLLGLLPWLYPGRTAELDSSVMWLEAGTRGRLLDVGAGSGWLVQHMNQLGWHAEGVDFDVQAVQRARGKGLVMHLGSLPGQRFPAGSFHAVTMSHNIEHVHDPLAWLEEARRILKPGGKLALATPNTRSFLHRRYGRHWFALDPPRHLHLFNRAALEALLRKAGFERFRIWTSVRDANGAFLGSRAIRAHGRFDMTAPRPRLERLRARAFQLLQAARGRFDADAGEDLVAIAER